MHDLYKTTLEFQKAWLKATSAMACLMTRNTMRLLDQQNDLFRQLTHLQRAEDDAPAPVAKPKRSRRKKAKGASPCAGADLRDHYGKRAHDIDVEQV